MTSSVKLRTMFGPVQLSFLSFLFFTVALANKGYTTTKYETLTADLVSAENLTAEGVDSSVAEYCEPGSLDPAKTAGKIVFCLRGVNARAEKGVVVKNAGGVGMILGNAQVDGDDAVADDHVLPALAVTAADSLEVLVYIKNNNNPVATLHPATTFYGVRPSPVVTGFSSLGPSVAAPDVLKLEYSTTPTTESGTHSDSKDPFEAGAGHINPNSAANPGLVYDASAADYTVFLCSLGYNDTQVEIITAQRKACSTLSQTMKSFATPSDLNLPSLTVANLHGTRIIRREVTNVDPSGSTYHLSIVPPSGVSVSISPSTLIFNRAGEKKTFYVTLKADQEQVGAYNFGSYTWYNGERKVTSPIVVGFIA